MFFNQFKKPKQIRVKINVIWNSSVMVKQTKFQSFYQTVTVAIFISKRSTESQERSTELLNANAEPRCDLFQEPSSDLRQRRGWCGAN